MTYEEFFSLPTIDSAFPLVYATGAKWTAVTVKCGRCDRTLGGENLRGSVHGLGLDPYRGGIPKVFVLDAQGYCDACELLTPLHYRLHEDMSMTGHSPHDGAWSRWAARPSLWARVRKWFKSL